MFGVNKDMAPNSRIGGLMKFLSGGISKPVVENTSVALEQTEASVDGAEFTTREGKVTDALASGEDAPNKDHVDAQSAPAVEGEVTESAPNDQDVAENSVPPHEGETLEGEQGKDHNIIIIPCFSRMAL